MESILIINPTRMGDILQTTPLIEGLKNKYPDARITLLANTAFREICRGIPFIDNLLAVDMRGCRERLADGRHSLVENYRLMEKLVGEINRHEYDLTLNLTHSPISAILTSLVRTREVRGFTVDPEGHRMIKHPWVRYFFNIVPNRKYNPFHIVDIYLKMGDTGPGSRKLLYEVSGDDEESIDAVLEEAGLSNNDSLVGIQLGASKSDRRWPISNFAALSRLISEATGAGIVLFGTSSEAELGREFEQSAGIKPLNMIGKTSIGQLAALLKRCSLLISNDTGTIHVATAVGTKVIGIFSVNAHHMETGPYGEGHYVLEADIPCMPCGFDVECRDKVCRQLVHPEAVFEIAKAILAGGEAQCNPDSGKWDNVQVYRSYFDEDGLLGFKPLLKRPVKREMIYRILYRHVWNSDFKEIDGDADVIWEKIESEIVSCYTLDRREAIMSAFKIEEHAVERMIDLSEKCMKLVRQIAGEAERDQLDTRKIKELWGKVEAFDDEIERLGHVNPGIFLVVEIFKYSKEAMEGRELKTLADASGEIYRELNYRLSKLHMLMKRALTFLEREPVQNHEDMEMEPAQKSGWDWYL